MKHAQNSHMGIHIFYIKSHVCCVFLGMMSHGASSILLRCRIEQPSPSMVGRDQAAVQPKKRC